MPISGRASAAAGLIFALLLAPCSVANAQDKFGPALRADLSGSAEVVMSKAQACDGDDVPDVNARAFRDDQGQTVVFALHDLNRALRGPDLDHLKIDCAVPFQGHGQADPAAYDDHAWIAALWTKDGRHVSALAHHEYHANEHAGRCVSDNAMACWYNSVIELSSADAGRTFSKASHPVVAAAPFRQDVDQTRHRGFFNPSNIVAFDGDYYFFASTTGWPGQDYGACLFRSRTPADPTSWRAFDGAAFTIRFRDPYASASPAPRPCAIIAPFKVPVGVIVRDRASGLFLAVWQAHEDAGFFPVSGFYEATSRDLLHWSDPLLLLAGDTLYDDPCRSGGRLINYPSILDPSAQTRDYEDVGAHPWLYFASLRVAGCEVTSDRILMRQRLTIAPAASASTRASR